MNIHSRETVEELKQRRAALRKELENKNFEITQCRKQLTTSSLRVSNYQQNIQELKTEIKADQTLSEMKIKELQSEIDKRKSHYSQVLPEQRNAIMQSQKTIEELKAKLIVVNNDSIQHDTTVESNEVTLELKVKQQLLLNLHEERNKIMDFLKKQKDDLENISSKDDAVKTDLFEQFDLIMNMEAEILALKTTVESWQESKEKSLFDEVNVQRQVLYKKLNMLKNQAGNLQKDLDIKKKNLVLMQFQCSQMEDVINKHPMEYQQDLDNLLFSYKNYIKMLKNLCFRLQDFLAKKKEIVNESLPENISKYCDMFNDRQQKYNDELKEISNREYDIRKLKSSDVRDIQLEILANEGKINRVLKKIANNEKIVDAITKEYEKKIDCEKNAVCDKSDGKTNEKVLGEVNCNIEHQKSKKIPKTVKFDDNAKCDDGGKTLRRGGRILEYKTVVFSKKKNKNKQ